MCDKIYFVVASPPRWDWFLKAGRGRWVKNQKFTSLESKFDNVVQLWVRRKLGRDLDVESNDYEVLFEVALALY